MADLRDLAIKLATNGPVKTLPTPRRIRFLFNGVYVADTTSATFIWEHPYFPQYYVPVEALTSSIEAQGLELKTVEEVHNDEGVVVATQHSLGIGTRSTDRIMSFSSELSGPAAMLKGLVRIEFASADGVFEEDTLIHQHPKDPYKRVDTVQSTRRITVSIAGKVVADSGFAVHLYETGLPTRYYLPLTSVDQSLLRPSKNRTKCPYKGEAEYYHVEIEGKVYENVVWYYNSPIIESAAVLGLVAFYNEHVDIAIDGRKVDRPNTLFGKAKGGQKPPGI